LLIASLIALMAFGVIIGMSASSAAEGLVKQRTGALDTRPSSMIQRLTTKPGVRQGPTAGTSRETRRASVGR